MRSLIVVEWPRRISVGRNGVEELLAIVADPRGNRIPEVSRACVAAMGTQLQMLKAQILEFDRLINDWHRSNEMSKRLDQIPGVGSALATELVASIADPKALRSGRDFSASLPGLPRGVPYSAAIHLARRSAAR